jgi:hypothetical protein
MWPTQPAAAAAVEEAATSLRTAAAVEAAPAAAVEAAPAAASRAASQQEQEYQQNQQAEQGQKLERGQLLLLPPLPGAPSFSLWGARRRHEWQLCFSTVPVKLSGRRRVRVEGLQVVVPDNAEQLLAGKLTVRLVAWANMLLLFM